MARRRDHFGAQGAVWGRRTWAEVNVGPREGLCSDQKAAQDTRGKLTLLHNLPSGPPGVEKRFEINVFTQQGLATWLLPAGEHVPGSRSVSDSPGGTWSLDSPWYVCRSRILCFGRLGTTDL